MVIYRFIHLNGDVYKIVHLWIASSAAYFWGNLLKFKKSCINIYKQKFKDIMAFAL